jgi:hypothetical protein
MKQKMGKTRRGREFISNALKAKYHPYWIIVVAIGTVVTSFLLPLSNFFIVLQFFNANKDH